MNGVGTNLKAYSRVSASVVLLLALAFCLTVNAQQQGDGKTKDQSRGLQIKTLPAASKRFAIVIGVDKYADTQITTLNAASNDAKSLAEALVLYSGFSSDQVTLLASDQAAERQPTRGNILRRLSNLATVVPKDGLLLFFFAGHGMERGGQAFLLPSDAQVSDDVELLEQTAINVSQIKDRIRKTGVGQVLIVLDACRNDPSGRANADNRLTPTYTRAFNFDTRNQEVTAFATLYATGVGERAFENKEKHQGYFTWALVEALKGGAANDKKEVTLAALVKYLQERVPRRVFQDLGQGKEQRPFAVIEGYRADDLVIAVGGAKATSQPADITFNHPTATGQDVRTNQGLEGTIWTVNTPESGLITIEFLKDGKYRYTLKTGSLGGTWKQSGNFIQLAMNNGYSVMEGTIEGNLIKVSGRNLEGTKWQWTLIKKE